MPDTIVKEGIIMSMKRLLAALCAAVMTAAMFTACGDSDSSSKGESSSKAEASSAAQTTTTTAAAPESEAPAESAPAKEAEDEPKEFDITQMPGYDASATETVFEFTDAPSDPWANGIPAAMIDGEAVTDYIDARSFDRDKDIHMVVEFAYTDSYLDMLSQGVTDQHKTQIVIGPARSNGWTKFGEEKEGLICDYPYFADYKEDGEWVRANGEDLCTPETKGNDKSEQVWPDVFVKGDGYLKIGNNEVTSVEFTIPADRVNEMIDTAFADATEDESVGWDGVLFQNGGNCSLTKITVDQGNVYLASQILEAGF